MKEKPRLGIFIYITYAIALFVLVSNFDGFGGAIGKIGAVFTPLLWGFGMAFVLNPVMKLFERLLGGLRRGEKRLNRKLKRALSVVFTFLTLLLCVFIIVNVITPTIRDSLVTLGTNLPSYLEDITKFYNELESENEILSEILLALPSVSEIAGTIKDFAMNAIPKIVSATISVTGGLMSALLGLIFAVYILYSKEKLGGAAKKLAFAFLPQKISSRICEICLQAHRTFEKYIGGRLVDAVILGTLCFLGMSIFHFPYAPIASFLVGITAFVPIAGAIISAALSAFLIMLEDPLKALWFLVFIIIVQVIENNIIFPRILGDSLGLSGFWILVGITVGGSVFGILGMLLSVPFIALLYSLLGRYVDRRLKSKEIRIE